MRIGVPKEIKVLENRVGLTPVSVREAVHRGHQVLVEHNAGQGIGMDDEAYRRAGAAVVGTAAEVFAGADMIVKVKEPQAVERRMLREGQVLFTYLHLAPDPDQAKDLLASRCGVHRLRNGHVALGRIAAARSHVGGRRPHGGAGRGVLPGKTPRRPRACCSAACRAWIRPRWSFSAAAWSGRTPATSHSAWAPKSWVLDRNVDVLRALWRQFGRPLNTVYSTHNAVEQHVATADLVIGGVLIPGASAPKLVSRD